MLYCTNSTIAAKFRSLDPLQDCMIFLSNGSVYCNGNTKKIADASYWDCTFAINKYITVGSKGKIAYSLDGSNWSTTTLGENYKLNTIVYGNNKFVIGATNYTFYSVDGINWSTPKKIGFDVCKIIFVNGKYLAVGKDFENNHACLATSTDGINWSIKQFSENFQLVNALYANGIYIVGGYNYFSYSTDGINWSTPKFVSSLKSSTSPLFIGIYYINGQYITCSESTTAFSNDGINWYTKDNNLNFNGDLTQGSYYINGTFFLTSFWSGLYSTSTDGINWATSKQLESQWINFIINKQN